jgi:hypothetical protein
MQPSSNPSPINDGHLAAEMAARGARPFIQQVVQSAWNAVVDVEPLHANIKTRIRELIKGCGEAQAIRCLTVIAPHGYGKTHLLAWVRQTAEDQTDVLFVPVAPWTPSSPDSDPLAQHVLRSVLDALWLRAHRQKQQFEDSVRKFLVECYDRILGESKRNLGPILRVRTKWWDFFTSASRFRISEQSTEDQLVAIQRAFHRREFLDRAFYMFEQLNLPTAHGARADHEAFVAACLLTCGNANQRYHADGWFRRTGLPPDVLAPFHLDCPCEGVEKVRNVLFTLNRLAGQTFCLAFDQMEDTYNALRNGTQVSSALGVQMAGLLRSLSTFPGFCHLFMFQPAEWQDFARSAPPMLVDRMVEGGWRTVVAPSQRLACRRIGASAPRTFRLVPIGASRTSRRPPVLSIHPRRYSCNPCDISGGTSSISPSLASAL